MMGKRNRACAGAAFALLAAAGCASLELPAPPAPPGHVTVTAVERRAWDSPEEQGLYRVEFDATRARAIARQAAILASTRYDGDMQNAEFAALEDDAGRELRARGKCSGLARLAVPVELGDGSAPVRAIFKCSPALF